MKIIRLQGEAELRAGIYYEYDVDSTPLGEGGMGRVFKGFRVNQRTGERMPVAIKAIYENIPERVVERARREAEIQVDHDNLIRMYGFVEAVSPATDMAPARVHYHVVMELLVGVTLEDILNGVTTDKSGMQIPFAAEIYNQYQNQRVAAAVRIMKAVLAGLMSLHDKGIIHRDIDPSNIMITLDNKIKLIDFGICKQIVTLGSQDKGLTATGVFMGKVNYAAPELVLGDVKSQNYTTDIYAMGVLLYQIVTGHLPFSGTDQDILASNLRKKLPMKDIKRGDIKKIIQKATEKPQSKRYNSAAEMRVALERVKPGSAESSVSPVLLISVVAAIAVVAACIFFFTRKTPDPIPVDPQAQDSIPVVAVAAPTSSQLFTDAVAKLSVPDSAASGYKALMTLANDSAYAPAMLEYGILCAKPTKAFPDIKSLQDMLEINPNIDDSNELLRKVLEREPTNYKAAYWVYNNLMTKFENNATTTEDLNQMASAFKLFKKFVDEASDDDAARYKNAMLNAGDEDTLRAWAIIN